MDLVLKAHIKSRDPLRTVRYYISQVTVFGEAAMQCVRQTIPWDRRRSVQFTAHFFFFLSKNDRAVK